MWFWGPLNKGSQSSAVHSVTQNFPLLCGRVTRLQGSRFLLKGLSELLPEVWLRHLADIDMRDPLCLCAVEFLWLYPDLTAHQGVVCITVRTMVRACVRTFLIATRLTKIRSSWCQCFERGCLHATLCWGLVWKKEFVMHRSWKVHSSSSRCPFSFILPTPNWPRREGHKSWSAPTLALKSSRTTTCSLLGMSLMMDARFS